MAAFTYNFQLGAIFNSGTGVYDITSDGNFSGGAGTSIATDNGNADPDLFENGEAITYGAGTTGTYLGTVTLNGEQFILIDNGLGTITGIGNVADPVNFNLRGLNGFGTVDDFPPGDIENQTSIDPDTVCFAAGTLISTPQGSTSVETLAIGDLILTADGRSVPVKWIGRQTVQKFFSGERARPVRVSAGALGDCLPHTDLVLTADHALILDGLAINAGALVNGLTISYDPVESLPDRVTYYHVETEDHDVIVANGAPAETYVDYVQRRVFDNYQEYLDLYGEERTIREMDLPRVSAARLVPPAIRARLNGEVAA